MNTRLQHVIIKIVLMVVLLTPWLGFAKTDSEENSFQSESQESNNEGWGEDWGDSWDAKSTQSVFGFVELAYGRFIDAQHSTTTPLNEIRTRLEWEPSILNSQLSIKGDVFYDSERKRANSPESAQALSAQFREFSLEKTLGNEFDIKLGRQILTWGTGDLIFINDLFPKDWQSFLIGRDDEYLKAPSDAIKLSWFQSAVSINVIYTPTFDPDNYINGERLSFYSPQRQDIAQPEQPFRALHPDDDEWHVRIHGRIESWEWAAYGYHGYFKSPSAYNDAGQLTFAPLSVVGGSLRGNLAGGVGYTEVGYYNSLDDGDGTNPSIPNSQFRLLLGFETELARQLTGAFQIYQETTLNYSQWLQNRQQQEPRRDKHHRLVTARLTYQALQQQLIPSLFIFYSPDEDDWHGRLKIDYRMNDRWQLSGGLHWFNGRSPDTFWSQFQDNNSVWLRLRSHF